MPKEDSKEFHFQKTNQRLLTPLFADDQVIIFITKDKLQKTAYKLNKIITQYGLTISTIQLTTKHNPSFGKNTGIQKKLFATYKQNAS